MALKAARSKILVIKDCVLNHIIDGYLGRFQIYYNILQLFNIFRYFSRKFFVALMRVNYKQEKISKVRFAQEPTCLNITIKQYAIQSGILYEKDLFKDKGQFKTLTYFYNVLRRKSNWLCEYKILKSVIFRTSLRFDMTCCSHMQPFKA